MPGAATPPNLNAFAERWVRSVKEECLRKLILFGEGSLRHALAEYVSHYHAERNHQGKANTLLFPDAPPIRSGSESSAPKPATRRLTQLLLPGRMNNLTIRRSNASKC
ncbi:integrase core domain-containing protein [Nevskia soli]|uniref:integrase core domain-containing protein n=1 Tax=Nevskia soli TaxID=418856 RepID=UPI00346081FD